ncbi:MAG: hypothetical protein LBE27_01215 [Deltaproteobacteria bacterium]|jgi:hypothetical protein|nr:hypothetical protein [Deltaproteobacteria bacterium]
MEKEKDDRALRRALFYTLLSELPVPETVGLVQTLLEEFPKGSTLPEAFKSLFQLFDERALGFGKIVDIPHKEIHRSPLAPLK